MGKKGKDIKEGRKEENKTIFCFTIWFADRRHLIKDQALLKSVAVWQEIATGTVCIRTIKKNFWKQKYFAK